MGSTIDLNPVSRITAGCVGDPGQRSFYIQARKDSTLVTLLCEKHQVQQLAQGVSKFVRELQEKFPNLDPAVVEYTETEMGLEEPIEFIFRVGQIGLGYDEDCDHLILVAKELIEEDYDAHDAAAVRLWASRSQMLAMGAHGAEIAARGRPTCGNCLQPIDPRGHFCPKSNGYNN